MVTKLLKLVDGPLDGGMYPMEEDKEQFGYVGENVLYFYTLSESFETGEAEQVLRCERSIPWSIPMKPDDGIKFLDFGNQ